VRAAIGVLAAFVLTASLVGCKQGQPGAPAEETRQRTEEEILKQQQAQDARLQELQAAMKDVLDSTKRREPESPLMEDLAAAERLLAAAEAYAAKPDEAQTKAVLARVEDLFVSARSLAPAAQMIEHLERAGLLIANQQSLNDAHGEFAAARAVTYSFTPSTLVPKVPEAFPKIDQDLKAGHGALAAESIIAAVDELNRDATLRSLRTACQSIMSARSAMDRSAWGVVAAEVGEMKRLIGGIRQVAYPAAQEEQKEESAPAATQPEAGAQQPAAQPAAEQSKAGTAPEQPGGGTAEPAQVVPAPQTPQEGAAPAEAKQPTPAAGTTQAETSAAQR